MSVFIALGTLFVGLVGIGIAVKEMVGAYRTHKRVKRLEEATPIEPTQARPGEEATIVGTVTADRPLRAPMGGEECAAYYRFAEIGPLDNHEFQLHRSNAVPCSIERGRTAVEIDPNAVDIETTPQNTVRQRVGVFSGFPDDYSEGLLDFWEREGLPEPEGFGGVRFRQKHVPVGETGSVTGTVVRRDGELVVTDDGGDCFLVDEEPAAFLESGGRPVLDALKRSAMFLVIGVAATLLGIAFLAA